MLKKSYHISEKKMKRVAITGIGMIDTLGNNPDDCFSSFVSDEYIDPVPYDWCRVEAFKHQKVFPVTSDVNLPDIPKKTVKNFDNNIKYALHAVEQALIDSGVPQSNNVAVTASSITAGENAFYESVRQLAVHGKMVNMKDFLAGVKDFVAGYICQRWGFSGQSTSINAACATSVYSIDHSLKLVDDYDYVVCCAYDCAITPISVPFFNSLGATGTHSDPFSETRDGFIPGDGAGCFILESEEKAKARGAKIHAYVYPAGFTTESYSPTSPDPDGFGAKSSMKKALENSGIYNVDFVNAHATSTPVGDDVELNAIEEVFGEIEIVAPKRKIGHTMGACGILEAIYGIKLLLKDGKKTFINNSFGFGGKCGSQVFEVE
jgi:3-oxoacyl-[acyl-carrier-protein] synthase II